MKTTLRQLLKPSIAGALVALAGIAVAQNAAPAPASGGGRTTGTAGQRTTDPNANNAGQQAAGRTQNNQGAQPNQINRTQNANADRTNAPAGNQPATGTNPVTANPTGQAINPAAPGAGVTNPALNTNVQAPAGNPSLLQDTLTNSGTISTFDASQFSLSSGTATPSAFSFGTGTVFLDSTGTTISPERFFQVGRNMPATVNFTRDDNGRLVATRVMLTERLPEAPIESAGTITEVSPGILVIEQPGASDTPIQYVNNKTTNYVNENGEPVPPESVKPGTPVRIFYTKVGDTLVASKVEVIRGKESGLPTPPVPAEQSGTTTKKALEGGTK